MLSRSPLEAVVLWRVGLHRDRAGGFVGSPLRLEGRAEPFGGGRIPITVEAIALGGAGGALLARGVLQVEAVGAAVEVNRDEVKGVQRGQGGLLSLPGVPWGSVEGPLAAARGGSGPPRERAPSGGPEGRVASGVGR